LAVAALVFAALAWASGAFAQDAEGAPATTEEGVGEPDAGPSTAAEGEATAVPGAEQTLQDQAEGPVDAAESAKTPEGLVGDVEGPTGDEEWGEFDEWEEDEGGESSGAKAWAFQLGGFVEGLVAPRVVPSSANSSEFTAAEARFRLNVDAVHEVASARFRGDVYFDAALTRIWFDIRDASIFVRGGSWFSMRLGRQVLTWGTGDFIFLNDLFPKDFDSFFIGRADAYLKAPSNSIRTTFMMRKVGLDLVWSPIFEGDRFIDGERLSFFNPAIPNGMGGTGAIQGDLSPFSPLEPTYPAKRLRNGTIHGRLYGSAGPVELAAYGYVGFWPQPNALTGPLLPPPDAPNATFTRLAVYGASVRAPLGGGLFNVEGAFWDSFDDRAGTDPTKPNSQFRGLAGYERELFPKFQMGLQYYLEYTFEYDELIANSYWPEYEPFEFRHVLTLRLTQLLVMDNLELSLFAFFSPNELDTYIRPRITYKIIEPLAFVVGANLMFGRYDYTMFGQLEQNTNVYVRLRYSF
jgi:hypothetical protein